MTTNGVGFDRLPILAELREQLNEQYAARAALPRRRGRPVRAHRWRPLALIAVLILGGATGALAAAGLFQSAAVIQHYDQSITPVVLRAINSPLCMRARVPATTGKTAPTSILSAVGVLARPSPPSRDRSIISRLTTPGTSLYVRYVRLARSLDGLDFYVSVSTSLNAAPVNINRCVAAVTANFAGELPHLPKTLRPKAVQIFDAALAAQRANWSQHPIVGVDLNAISIYGAPGFGGGPATAAQIEQGRALSEGGAAAGSGPNSSLIDGLVPNAVASITLHYDAGPLGGYSHTHARATNITTRPINNVFVAIVPRPTGNALPSTITWRAANGKIIRTIHER
jgi:hypothetical protein